MADENASSVSVARIRQVVLLIILALAVVALIFEFTVVRPKVFAAWDAVSELIETNYANPGQVTNTDKRFKKKLVEPLHAQHRRKIGMSRFTNFDAVSRFWFMRFVWNTTRRKTGRNC